MIRSEALGVDADVALNGNQGGANRSSFAQRLEILHAQT